MFHLVLSCQIVRKLLVSGAHSSGGGTFSQPPPPFVSHATARTPRAHRRGPANAAASLSFARPSPRPTLDWTPGAARASPARHEASRGVRDSAGVREALQVRGEKPEEHRGQSGPTALLPVAQEGTPRARPTPSTPSSRAFRARSLRTGGVEENPHPLGNRLSGGSGARTFFSRARRSFPPVRAFRAFATAAQPDRNPRVSDSSDEEISALPNGFGR